MKKHVRVRKQITEGKKIRDIEAALLNSDLLKEIEPETGDFEKRTEKEMTEMLNQEEQGLRELEIEKWVAEQKLKLRTISYSKTVSHDGDAGGPRKMDKGSFMFSKRTLNEVLSPR